MTPSPYDEATFIIEKKSFVGTANKTNNKQNEQQIADMMSGFLKYEYNYGGYISGSFKLVDSPATTEFDNTNVV